MTTVTVRLDGVSPVLEVPFLDDGTVDHDGFGAIVDHVLAAGVRSVMFPGFASEFYKLTDAERRQLTTILLARTRRQKDIAAIVSVPDHATRVAVERASAAVAEGADAINVLPPHLVPPGPAGILAHLGALLDAVYPTPVIVQYAPHQTGTALDAATLARLRDEHPNLAAVKVESTPPGRMIAALSALEPPLPAFVGYAGLQMIDAFNRGAVGVQPGCSFVELYLRVWSSLTGGDQSAAEALHARMVPYLSYWMQGVELVVAVEKEISRRRGLIRSAHCRAPAHLLDRHELAMVDRFLREFDGLLPEGRP